MQHVVIVGKSVGSIKCLNSINQHTLIIYIFRFDAEIVEVNHGTMMVKVTRTDVTDPNKGWAQEAVLSYRIRNDGETHVYAPTSDGVAQLSVNPFH